MTFRDVVLALCTILVIATLAVVVTRDAPEPRFQLLESGHVYRLDRVTGGLTFCIENRCQAVNELSSELELLEAAERISNMPIPPGQDSDSR